MNYEKLWLENVNKVLVMREQVKSVRNGEIREIMKNFAREMWGRTRSDDFKLDECWRVMLAVRHQVESHRKCFLLAKLEIEWRNFDSKIQVRRSLRNRS